MFYLPKSGKFLCTLTATVFSVKSAFKYIINIFSFKSYFLFSLIPFFIHVIGILIIQSFLNDYFNL